MAAAMALSQPAECAAYPRCREWRLEGDCCPTPSGQVAQCCHSKEYSGVKFGDLDGNELENIIGPSCLVLVVVLCVLYFLKRKAPADDRRRMMQKFGSYFPAEFPCLLTRRREAGQQGYRGASSTSLSEDSPDDRYATWARALFKWVIPFTFNVSCNYICVVFLHIGTYSYVHMMTRWEDLYKTRKHLNTSQLEGHGNRMSHLSMGITVNDTSFGSLDDQIHKMMGFQEVDIAKLDMIAAVFPICFFGMAILLDELGSWTKIMLCHGVLAFGKGFFGMITVVPDSAGWKSCTARLKEEGVRWMQREHDIGDLFRINLFGYNPEHKHLRWCADMMWSGHTYVTTLYALGLFELIRIFTREWELHHHYAALGVTFVIATAEQMIEVYFVLKNRFHYSMDVFMAILLTFLFYTNGVIAKASKWWVKLGTKRLEKKWDEDTREAIRGKVQELQDKMELPKDAVVVQLHRLLPDGEVIVPPCCVPCCCPWCVERQHLYSDKDIGNFLFSASYETRKEYAHDMRVSFRHCVSQEAMKMNNIPTNEVLVPFVEQY